MKTPLSLFGQREKTFKRGLFSVVSKGGRCYNLHREEYIMGGFFLIIFIWLVFKIRKCRRDYNRAKWRAKHGNECEEEPLLYSFFPYQ